MSKADSNFDYPPHYTPGYGQPCPAGDYPPKNGTYQPQNGAYYTPQPAPGVVIAQPGTFAVTNVASRPRDYLVPSIIACLCCFWPTGLIAIIYSYKSSTAFRDGDVERAYTWSNRARNLMISSVVIGVIWITLVIVLRLTVYSHYYNKDYYYHS